MNRLIRLLDKYLRKVEISEISHLVGVGFKGKKEVQIRALVKSCFDNNQLEKLIRILDERKPNVRWKEGDNRKTRSDISRMELLGLANFIEQNFTLKIISKTLTTLQTGLKIQKGNKAAKILVLIDQLKTEAKLAQFVEALQRQAPDLRWDLVFRRAEISQLGVRVSKVTNASRVPENTIVTPIVYRRTKEELQESISLRKHRIRFFRAPKLLPPNQKED